MMHIFVHVGSKVKCTGVCGGWAGNEVSISSTFSSIGPELQKSSQTMNVHAHTQLHVSGINYEVEGSLNS